MKVLFISRLYPNQYNTRNGVVMHRLALELKKNGVEVQVLSPIPYMPKIVKNIRENWQEYYSLPEINYFEGIKIYNPRYLRFPFGIKSEYMYKFVIKSTEKIIESIYQEFPFDLIHAHMAYPDNFAGIQIKNKFNVPLITTIRSSDLDISVKNNKIKRMLKESLSHSDFIISPSPQLSQKLKKIYGYNSIHIGNGVYPEYLLKEITDISIPCDIMNDLKSKKVILSVSNLIESKGIQYNIKAMSKLIHHFPNMVYLIIGDGPYKKKLTDLVNELNLNNYVKFLGELSHNKVMKYMDACDIFSMPSWRETFGLVYLEAMYLKKPVILCENQGIDGAIRHRYSGMIVPPHSVEPIVDCVKELLINSDLNREISKNGYNIVLNNYTWEEVGKKTKEVYLNLVNGINI